MKAIRNSLIVLLLLASSAWANPAAFTGIKVWKGSWFTGGAVSGVTNASYVSSMSGFYNWNACEPSKGTFTYNVTNCNIAGDVTWATTYGKKLSINIAAGAYVPTWVSSDMTSHGSSAFWTSVFDKNGSPPYTCGSFIAYDSRDPTYIADLEALYTNIHTTYGGNVIITGIGLPGDGVLGELGSLPWHQGETLTCTGTNCTSTCGANPCTCNSANDVAALVSLGWTPQSYLANSVVPMTTFVSQLFTNQVVMAHMTSGSAPCINSSGAVDCSAGGQDNTLQPSIVATLSATNGAGNVGALNDGATATFMWSSITQWQAWLYTGSQAGSAASYGIPGFLQHAALALNSCIQFDELYISTLQDSTVQPYLPWYNEALVAGCAPPVNTKAGFIGSW